MYQQNQSPPPQMPRLSSRDTPLTLVLIGASALTFLLGNFTNGSWLTRGLALTAESLHFPWTLVTWPLVGTGGALWTLCNAFWAWTVCGSMERAWGTAQLTKFVLATTVLTGTTVLLAIVLLPLPSAVFASLGMSLPAVTVAWCWINRAATIRFQFLFPISALWIAGITVLLQFFYTAQMLHSPWAGFAGLSGSTAAWWWIRGGRSWFETRFGKKKNAPNLRFADMDRDMRGAKQSNNPFKIAREEKQRLERDKKIAEMFRNSGFKDDSE